MATNEEFKWAGSSEPVSVAANKVADLATFGVVVMHCARLKLWKKGTDH
jgi:hypothetical protein